MITLYYFPSPNPIKVALFLEEAEVPYELVVVDTRKGDQHKPEFLRVNPNAKTPAIMDGDVRVFDSNAILLYLAEKYEQFLPPAGKGNRAELLSWLMFVATGIGPYCGQAVHFKNHAPTRDAYAINRYDFEAWRHWNIINEHLATRRYMVAETYTIVDMSVWGWARLIPNVLGADAFARLPNVKRLLDEINARPAAQRAEDIKTQHAFKVEIDEEARRNLFPQNARLTQ